ncbi:MAG: PepSY domain-containing protein [Armatimonadetes bacterium]|nr:PepSY domain-containing protein [Armatimonadota bacterium]
MIQLRILALTCCILVTMIEGCSGQSVITPEQAMNAVRAFEGDNTLQLKCWELKAHLEGPEWRHVRIYDLDDMQNEDHSWTVDAVTGEVTSAFYRDAYSQDTEEPTGPLTGEQCRQIAEDLARAKYAGFDTMSFQLDEPEWDGDGWSFFWSRENIYGARVPNDVKVDVNPADGRIQYYGCYRLSVSMPSPQKPQIAPEQAVEIVKTAKGLVTGAAESDPVLSADPDHTMWSLVVYGESGQREDLTYYAEVDALTGEIIRTAEPMGRGHMPIPPKPCVSGALISLRGLAAEVPGSRVHWLGNEGVRLFIGKNRYTLVPGKDTIEWTGGTIKLSQKMKIVDGRLMVPSDLLDILKAAPAPKRAPNARAKSK